MEKKSETKVENAEPLELRSLDDFLLKSARFGLPDTGNSAKWLNRVHSNWCYYQANYFCIIGGVFIILGILHPRDVAFCGFFLGAGYVLFVTKMPFLLFVALFFFRQVLTSAMILLWGLLVSGILILTHASLRLRNLKNKLAHEKISIKQITQNAINVIKAATTSSAQFKGVNKKKL